jgi:hypothetical protein
MKKLLSLTLLCCFFTSLISAQATTNLRNDMGLVDSGLAFTKTEKGAAATGSPYYDDTYRSAKLSPQAVTPIRYNANTDRIEFMAGAETRMLMPQKDSVIQTMDKKYAYIYTDYVFEGNNEEGYLIILAESPKVKVYSKQRVGLQAETESSNGYQTYRPASYQKKPMKYFIKIDSDPIVQFSAKKKELIKLFPGKETEITEYLKKNKVDSDNENDMVRLGGFLSSL